MKRKRMVFIVAILLLALTACVLSACDSLKFKYNLRYDGKFELRSYTGRAKVVQVPEEHLSSTVAAIGVSAFEGNSRAQKIILPSTVVDIFDKSFKGCTALREIELSERLLTVGDDAFRGCTALTQMVLPSSVKKLGGGVFADCTSLTSFVTGAGIMEIGSGIFNGCDQIEYIKSTCNVIRLAASPKLKKVEFLGDRINANSINAASPVEEATISDETVIIYYSAFAHCKSLRKMHITKYVTAIYPGAFFNCPNLVLTLDGENSRYTLKNGCIYDTEGTLVAAFGDSRIPDDGSVTKINTGAYANYPSDSLEIPEGITTIDGSAFLSTMRVFTLPASLKTLSPTAFATCTDVRITFNGTEEAWAALSADLNTDNITDVTCLGR